MIFASLRKRKSGKFECHELTIFPLQSTSIMSEYWGRIGEISSKLIICNEKKIKELFSKSTSINYWYEVHKILRMRRIVGRM